MVWVRSTHKHRENESRTEQRDRKKNENQKWMRWNWVSSHDVYKRRTLRVKSSVANSV